jgi:hypothetical protein
MKVFQIRQSFRSVEATDFKIQKCNLKKSTGRILRLLRFRGCFRGHRGQNFKITNHSFMTFHNIIFVILGFEVVWHRQPRQPQKELGEYFQRLHFWNQWVPLIKMHCRVCYLFDFDLKIHSGQVCDELLWDESIYSLGFIFESFEVSWESNLIWDFIRCIETLNQNS